LKKRGLSPIFQYILVAVIGGIILLFFIRFAYQSSSSFDTLNSVYIKNTLKDSLVALTVSESSSMIFPEHGWPEEVSFVIGEEATCGKISVGESDFVPFSQIVYGPPVLNGKRMEVWTRSWEYPFEINNLFYVTNKNTKYFLVYNENNKRFVEELDSFASEIEPMEHIPREFNVRAVSYSNVDENYVSGFAKDSDFVKFVFFDVAPNIDRGTNVEVARVNVLDCQNDYDCKGSVFFGTEERGFYGRAMLYGVIFAGSLEQYDCNFDKAMNAIEVVSNLYVKKAELLCDKTDCCYSGFVNNVENLDMENFAENVIDFNYGDDEKCQNLF